VTGLAIALALLLAAALTRLGVSARYDAEGLTIDARGGFIRFRPSPRARRAVRPGRRARDGAKKKRRRARREREGPGGPVELTETARAALTALSRLRRKLLIKRLIVRYSAPGAADPAAAAVMYGRMSAGAGALLPLIDGAFRVRERDIAAGVDFTSDKPRIFVSAAISIAVWEAVYTAWALLPAIAKPASERRKRYNIKGERT
jgi:hypothetical protein